jgi:hypothetical protein
MCVGERLLIGVLVWRDSSVVEYASLGRDRGDRGRHRHLGGYEKRELLQKSQRLNT